MRRVGAGVVGVVSVSLIWVLSMTPAFAASVVGVSPSQIAAGAADTVVQVTGSGFVSGDQVRMNGVVVTTVFVDVGTLSGTVPASMLEVDKSLRVETVSDSGAVSDGNVVLTVGAGGNAEGLTMEQWHMIVFSLLGGIGAYLFVAGIGRPW